MFGKLRDLGIAPAAPAPTASSPAARARHLWHTARSRRSRPRSKVSTDPEKRARWVERLLERPEYADLFAMQWSAILRNQRSFGTISQPGTFAFHDWIRQALAENMPYDRSWPRS